jgi:hypothetical protein
MQIQSIKYGNEDQSSLNVTLTDGSQMFVPWPSQTWHGETIQKWLLLGNIIADAFTTEEKVINAKSTKIYELRVLRLAKIQAVLPGVTNDDTLELISELWKSIAGAAQAPTTEWQSAIDIFTAGKQAGVALNALATLVEVVAYDINTDPSWPA